VIAVSYVQPDKVGDDSLVIEGVEAHHLRKVMRLKMGDPAMAVDGCGNGYKVEIEKFSGRRIECKIHSRIRRFGEPMNFVTLAAGLSVGYKFDEVVQRATELGISRIIPMITEKSKIKLDDERRQKLKLNRWRKVAIASMKQTGRSLIPEITPLWDFMSLFSRPENLGRKILFDPLNADKNIAEVKIFPGEESTTILIGPESGFSRTEIEMARENKCEIVSMGKRVLRTENASPVAIALVMNLLGELR
jgi:16S rRNA (uracil1498-N3)-methyltransferase